MSLMRITELQRHTIPMPGIYFLWQDDELQYIGKSSNILKRIGEHATCKVFDTYSFIECDIADMATLEQAYIKQYQPPLNTVHTDPRPLEDTSVMVDASQYSNIINDMRDRVRFKQYDREAKEAGRW